MAIQCNSCLSYNYIYEYIINAQAWECWNCHERFWISDEIKYEYMTVNNMNLKHADLTLKEGNLIFINGQSMV